MTSEEVNSKEQSTMPVSDGVLGTESTEGDKTDSILARKLKKILESDLEADTELAEALAELSTFFPENTLKTRRFLRGDIERRSLEVNKQFLEEMSSLNAAAEAVVDLVVAMNTDCQRMRATLDATKSKTRDLIMQTTQLQQEAALLSRKETKIEEFLSKYQLTEEQVAALRGTNMSSPGSPRAASSLGITDSFFSALDRAQKIHSDCKTLLFTQSGQQTKTALEIMEQMSAIMESALERLYRWTTAQCRSASSSSSLMESASESATLLAKAMRCLQSRPKLFKCVLDEYCTARKTALVRGFLDALTVGGGAGFTAKPIELHAHDPPRYIGDMMAWLHQALPGENESLRALLRLCCDEAGSDEVEETCQSAMAVLTEDVCRPLRTRVEQILLLEAGPVVLYKLSGLIRFYVGTIRQSVPATSSLVSTLEDLQQMAYKQFMSVLQAAVAAQTTGRGLESPAHDLAPTPSSVALLSLLRELLSASSVVDECKEQLQEIVSVVIEPLLAALQTMAESFPTTDQDVFMLNSLYQMHTTLSLFQFNDNLLQSLHSDMQLRMDTLASEQTSNLIANLGLQPVCTMVAECSAKSQPLSKVSGMEAAALEQFLAKFDNFLVAPEVFLLPQTRMLLSSAHRKNVTKRSLEVVSASYAQLYEAVLSPGNLYENPQSLMPKNPEQVSLLLQL